RGGLLSVGAPAGGKQGKAADEAEPAGDGWSRWAVDHGAEGVVERDLPWAEGAEADADDGEDKDVLVTVLEDEESVAAVRGEPGDDHGPHNGGRRERGQQPDQQCRACREFDGDAGERVHPGRAQPDPAEPALGPGDTARAAPVVVPVRQHRGADDRPEDQADRVRGLHVTPLGKSAYI